MGQEPEPRRRYGELIVPLMILALTAAYLWDVRGIARPELNLLLVRPLALLVIALALFIIVKAVVPRRMRQGNRRDIAGDGEGAVTSRESASVLSEEPLPGSPFDRLAVVWLVLFVTYLVALSFIDFRFVTPAYLTALMLFLGVRSWIVVAVTVVGVTSGIFLIFDLLLGVGLP